MSHGASLLSFWNPTVSTTGIANVGIEALQVAWGPFFAGRSAAYFTQHAARGNSRTLVSALPARRLKVPAQDWVPNAVGRAPAVSELRHVVVRLQATPAAGAAGADPEEWEVDNTVHLTRLLQGRWPTVATVYFSYAWLTT